MNNDYNNKASSTYNLQKKIQQMNRRTRYVLNERDYGKGKRKFIKFDERYIQQDPMLVEDVISSRYLHIALNQALAELTADENEIITECFFESEKVNFTKLAKKHKVSRQAYCRKEKRILQKLKKSVVFHYNKLYNLCNTTKL